MPNNENSSINNSENQDEKSQLEKFKKYPFGNTELMATIGQAAQRSRQFFMILLFSGAFIFMSFINSFYKEYNWFKLKLEKYEVMDQYFVFDDDSGYAKFSDFILQNEDLFSREYQLDHKTYLSIVTIPEDNNLRNVSFRLRKIHDTNNINLPIDKHQRELLYIDIAKAIDYARSSRIYCKDQITKTRDFLIETKIKNLDQLSIPVLGIAFNINYLGLYSAILLSIIYTVLSFLILSEYTNIKIALDYNVNDKSTHHYFFYSLLAMQQVLFRPRKLFEPNKSNAYSTRNVNGNSILINRVYNFYIKNKKFRQFIYLCFIGLILVSVKQSSSYAFSSVGFYMWVIVVIVAVLGFHKLYYKSEVITSHLGLFNVGMTAVLIVFLIVIGYDAYTTKTGNYYGNGMTIATIIIYCFLSYLVIVTYSNAKQNNRKVDHLWQNLAIEYNLEFILESIEERRKTDLLSYGKQRLGVNSTDIELDKIIVKLLWNETINDIQKERQTVKFYMRKVFFNKEHVELKNIIFHLEKFIDACFSFDVVDSLRRKHSKTTLTVLTEVSQRWSRLLDWFNVDDSEKLHRSFARTLYSDVIAQS